MLVDSRAGRAAPAGVTGVVSVPAGVRFTVHVPEPRWIEAEGGRTRVVIEGYDALGEPGGPEMPLRVVQVAVPPQGEVRVEASAVGVADERALDLAPVPERIARGEPVREVRIADPRAYADPALASKPPARLLSVSWLRNQRVASIAVEPLSLDASGHKIRVQRDISIVVQVTGAGEAGPPIEPSDPFERIYRDVLVNYDQGRAWRRSSWPERAGGTPPVRLALAPLAGPDTTSVFAGRHWTKFAIAQTGFYRVNFGQVRETLPFVDKPAEDRIRLFTWPGVPILPEDSYCDSCDYHEVAIAFVDKQNDGTFNDNEDYFYFFALGPNDWKNVYDASKPDTDYVNNPYEINTYYYATVSEDANPVPGAPDRIAVQSAAVVATGGEVTPTTFHERAHFEIDAEYFPDATPLYPRNSTYFWEKWFWRSLDAGRTFSNPFDLPGADTTQSARLRLRLWGLAARDTCRDVVVRRPDHQADVVMNGHVLPRYAWGALRGFTVDTVLTTFRTRNNALSVSVPLVTTCPSRIDKVGVAWFDVSYARNFVPVQNELAFESPTAPGSYIYRVGPFSTDTPPRVFDVTDAYHPIELLGFDWTTDALGRELAFETTQNGLRRYRIVRDSSIVKLPSTAIADAPATSLTNLRSAERRADYLVIYYDAFKDAAALLASWRQTHDGFTTDIVPISALYDQFSGGRTDPAAIRNFLRAAYRNWQPPRPAFVTLLGDASYDFKNLTGRAPSGQPGTLLPSYEGGFDINVGRQFATDDWLLNVDNARVVVPDFFGGRIPADDAATALDVVRNKLILYDQSAPVGEYRNKIMLIADDNMQGDEVDLLHWQHLEQTAELDSSHTPQHLDRVYVYLHTYPTESGSIKPAAKNDIIQNIDGGLLMFNYIGHGSPFKLSDENVFLDTDVGTLSNTTRLPVFIAASCDIGKFNDPTVQSLGELLMITPGRGAIAVVSATELALSFANAIFNEQIYDRLFTRDASGSYHYSVAEAMLSAKNQSANSQKYQLMGDAATRPNLPRRSIEVSLWDSAGTTQALDLARGRTYTFRGRVLDRPGGTVVPLEGVAELLIEDSAPLDQAPPCSGCAPTSYYFSAGPLFRGNVSCHDGAFAGRFVVPLEAKTGPRARVRAYVEEAGATASASPDDGVGSMRLQLNPGAPPAGDVSGPRINLSFTSGSTTVRRDATLRIDLSDPSGILITAHSAQNGIVVTVDGNTTGRVDVTPSFRCAADSYQSGTALFQLPNLELGGHTIQVSAADNLAAGLGSATHRSTASISFEVVDQPQLKVASAFLFPNPVFSGGAGSGGWFVVNAPGDSVNVLLRIYTVSGRLIRELRALGGLGQVQIPWDGLDDEGGSLANGLYLFKVHVNSRDPDGSSSALQSAESDGRLVIVNR